MDQDYRQKSGQEEHDDAVQDQIRAKEKEIKELREEIRELRAKIRELRAEIRVKEEEKRRMEEIAIASEAEVRKVVETELQFLWQHMINHDQQIISRDQQIISLRQELSCLRSMQEARASAGM